MFSLTVRRLILLVSLIAIVILTRYALWHQPVQHRVNIPTPCPSPLEAETPLHTHGAFVWQGFHHEWLREIPPVGIRTPHRMGSFDNHLSYETFHPLQAGKHQLRACASFQFTPGVNADYAYPSMRWNAFYAPNVSVARGAWAFQVQDEIQGDYRHAVDTGHFPRAMTHIERDQRITLGPELGQGQYDNYAVLLRGFKLDMDCIAGPPKRRGKGFRACNSDGIWADAFFVSISGCRRPAPDALTCPLTLSLERSRAPLAFRPLNAKMKYHIVIFYTLIGGNDGDFNAVPAHAIHTSGRIHAKTVDRIATTGDARVQGAPDYRYGMMGLTALGYRLHHPTTPLNRLGNLGRYMSALHFTLNETRYTPSSGEMVYTYEMAFLGAKLVYDSDVDYHMQGMLLQFSDEAKVVYDARVADAPRPPDLRGSACFGRPYRFSCKRRNVPSSTRSAARFEMEL